MNLLLRTNDNLYDFGLTFVCFYTKKVDNAEIVVSGLRKGAQRKKVKPPLRSVGFFISGQRLFPY